MLVFLLILIITLAIYRLFFISWTSLLPAPLIESKFFYYGHRGAPKIAPENTIHSFKTAIDNGVDGIELDVQLSKDNNLIVYHDKYIRNNSMTISSMNLNEINKIDVRNDFKNLSFQKIPLLKEVLDVLPNNIVLNIEIKSYQTKYFSNIEKQVVRLINKYSIENQIIISSFNPFIIRKIKKINPYIATAFIWSSKSYYNYKVFSCYAKPDAFHVNINDINDSMINWVKKKNVKIYAYTINAKSDLDKAKQYKLSGIFTDNPEIKNV